MLCRPTMTRIPFKNGDLYDLMMALSEAEPVNMTEMSMLTRID
jgi:hypothetical protein